MKSAYESARRPVSRVLSAPLGFPGGAGRPFLWDAPRGAPHATNPDGEAGMPCARVSRMPPAAPIRSCSRWGLPCRPCCQGRGALLPHRFTLARGPRANPRLARAVCFLWHFPWGRPRRRLAGTVFPWSPDFPLPAGEPGAAAVRPSGEARHAAPSIPGVKLRARERGGVIQRGQRLRKSDTGQ